MIRAENLALDGAPEGNLSALVGQALAPAPPERRRLDAWPPVRLKRFQIVPVSLILHESVVNALKYGALSSPDGVVYLAWSVAAEDGKNVLHLAWR